MSDKKIKTAWEKYTPEQYKKTMDFAEEYRKFMSVCKTERECASYMVEEAKKAGFTNLLDYIGTDNKLKQGDKVYALHQGRLLTLFTIGKQSFEKGMNIIGAHTDSPRLDLKPKPLYEDNGLAFFDTHYYGGIKKYQWVATPLALHGMVVLKDGTKIDISLGEDINEPVIGISDLLIHLSAEQMKKTLAKGVEGEDLNILVGSIPINNDDKKGKVKLNVLNILKEKYGIEEDDFMSAELQAVPAGPARNYGIDNSMLAAYGHDDRICSYSAFKALLNVKDPELTTVALIVDKEEIGSVGATGMQSKFFENMLAELMVLTEGNYDELKFRRCFMNSQMLSGDVSAAFDPNYPSAYEKNNTPFFGMGVSFNKYTGSRGKSGSNDTDPEFLAKLRRILDNNNITWQIAELGKVDVGGGGTIAYILANYGMDVIDCGTPVQNMHAPYEVASKADLYETYRTYYVFLMENFD